MQKIFSRAKSYVLAHKIISVIIVAVIIYGGYRIYDKLTDTSGEVRYVVETAQKGTLIASITGSGQVSSSNQVDIKPKASGSVVYVGVASGQTVKAGTLVAQLDTRDAQKAVRDAEISLESAKLQMEKLQGPEGLIVPKNKEQAQEDLLKAYDDGFNTVSNVFLDLPSIMSGLQDAVLDDGIEKGHENADFYADAVKRFDESVTTFRDDARSKYAEARSRYDKNFLDYKNSSRFSDKESIDAIISETYATVLSVAESVKSTNNLIQFYKDKLKEQNISPAAQADTYLAQLNSHTGKTNSHLLSLLSIRNSIKNSKDAILTAGLDIRSQDLTIRQKEASLLDANENLANYYVRAPFDGTIAQVNIKKLDQAGSGTAVAVIVTKQKIAEISLNEVDVAKVKVGQKVNITFDAVEGLNITGVVAEIDTIGTVTQGVVSYNVKISFDTQDDRVKSGMSVSAAIITDVKQDVLLVPNSAVKTQGNSQSVQVFDPKLTQPQGSQVSQGLPAQAGMLSATVPKQQTVETGLSNDTQIEITSGIKEGDQIVVRTITAPTTTTTAVPSLFGGGGGARIGR